MNTVVQVFALVGAAVHVLAFVWEVFVFGRPGVHRDIFRIPTSDVPAVRMWAFNVGFYNLFVAAGAVAGVVALFVSDRLAMSRPRGAGIAGSIAQTVPPAVALLAAVW